MLFEDDEEDCYHDNNVYPICLSSVVLSCGRGVTARGARGGDGWSPIPSSFSLTWTDSLSWRSSGAILGPSGDFIAEGGR